MADEDLPPAVTPVKQTPQGPQGGHLTPRSKKWKTLDFSGQDGSARSTLGDSPNQKALKVLHRGKFSPRCTRQKRKSSSHQSVGLHYGKRKRMNWSEEETKALLLCIHSHGFKEWPQMEESHVFWKNAADFIKKKTGSKREVTSVRAKVTPWLMKEFDSLEAAFHKHDIATARHPSSPEEASSHLDISKLSPVEQLHLATNVLNLLKFSDLAACIKASLKNLTTYDAEFVANMAFYELALKKDINSYPTDFAKLSSDAMVRLQAIDKPNVMYKFAKCLGECRPGTQDEPLMPLTRMPFGLIEYQVEFFSCTNVSQITMPSDFRLFQDMMEAEFGERFNKLFRGPAWSGCESGDMKNPLKARINVACVSHQTITDDFKKKFNLTTTSEIQVTAMEYLKKANPNGRFWIKADGTDIKAALQESMDGKWNGDPDLQDGRLQALRADYDRRIDLAKATTPDHGPLLIDFEKDKTFLKKHLDETSAKYKVKKKNDNSSTEKLKELNWEIVELVDLLEMNAKFILAYKDGTMTSVGHMNLKADLLMYLRNLYKKRRAPAATHVLVIMLSDERRARKPYAMPVQYVPYHSLTADDIERLTVPIKEKMVELGMKCCGLVTDGEFKKLRYVGVGDRPIHIYKLINQTRSSVGSLVESTLLKLITKIAETEDGQPITEKVDPCIPHHVIDKLHKLQQEGNTLEDSLTIIKDGLLEEEGFKLLPWREHCETETKLDLLRTIVATYRYRSRVAQLEDTHNVDFRTNLCEPEVDATTGELIYKTADHNHLMKRIGFHTRDGGPEWVNVARFVEAVEDKTTDLNMPACLGTRKQSTLDAEKLLSHAVADFFEKKGYTRESKYTRIVARWHEATDGRGMSQEERRAANLDMREMILDEWMPWHKKNPDLSKIDINRRLKGICGFSQETVIELTANIECQERRRMQNEELGYAEHPRSGTTDDVECFFALLHRITGGQHVTLGAFRYWWQKLVIQFSFRMDHELPFYVHTLNERYSLEDQPSFDEPQPMPRLHRLTRRSREDSSIIAGGRAYLPTQHSASHRHTWYKLPQAMSAVPAHMEEHIRPIRDDGADIVVTD